jgi:serine/threonine-protein kinase
VRLLDFGLARLREGGSSLTQEAAVLGTPGYLAPEQARGRVEEIGPHTDVFALGVILFRALTGVQPFPAGTALQALEQVCLLDPRPPSSVLPELPADVDRVVALALAKLPAHRYARAGELARDLQLAARGELPPEVRARAAALPATEAATLELTANAQHSAAVARRG